MKLIGLPSLVAQTVKRLSTMWDQGGHPKKANSSPTELDLGPWPGSWKARSPFVRLLPRGSILGSPSCPGPPAQSPAGLPAGSLHGCFWP